MVEYRMYCILGNIHPFRPRCQYANSRLGEFQCLMLSFFEHIFVWASSRRGNIVYKCIGAKILHGAKMTLFTVCVHWLSPWRCPSATLSRDNSNKQRGIRHFRLSIRQGQCQLRVKIYTTHCYYDYSAICFDTCMWYCAWKVRFIDMTFIL